MSLFLFLLVSGLAAASACGSSWTFLFTFMQETFFLSILLSVMSDHDGRCSVAYYKHQIEIFDKATAVKTIYKQSSRTGIPSHVSAQTLGHYILDLNPSTVSAEAASVASPFQVAIVLIKRKFSVRSYMHSDGDTERGVIWYSCSLY